MIKKTLIILLVVGLAVVFWFSFALWTGIYSVYSFPPSAQHPEGATLIVARDEGEPMFNSPQFTPPPVKQTQRRGSITFTPESTKKRPLELRTIVELPYIQWAYERSLSAATAN